jgi:membrane protein YqaA with SNARE-associated domain
MSAILELGAYASLCALAYVSALVPIVNAELLVVGSSAVAGKGWTQALTVAVVVAVGQMVGKVTLYLMGRGASKIPSERQRKAIDRWGHRFSQSPRMVMLLVFASAASGFPPFYAISVLAGTFRVNLAAFFVVGLAGRILRFGILALAPGWLGWHAPGLAP